MSAMVDTPASQDSQPLRAAKIWQLGDSPWQETVSFPPQSRIIIDNDFAGDPDGAIQLVHHLLSPTVQIRAVIASHLGAGPSGGADRDGSADAVAVVHHLFTLMGLASTDIIVQGAAHALSDPGSPVTSSAVDVIVDEALRDDNTPLYYVAGGGLTDLASAILTRPEIASRLTLVWIGGPEHPGIAPPLVGAAAVEYNLDIDLLAAQVVFDAPGLAVWQVPRDAYRQCLVPIAELRTRLRPAGPLGRHLHDQIEQERLHLVARGGRKVGESYDLGDSVLVLLTVLQSTFEPDTASSTYLVRPRPAIQPDGSYHPRRDAGSMRIYTRIDTRLVVEDFFVKLAEFAQWQDA
jgi:purine nucleosidase